MMKQYLRIEYLFVFFAIVSSALCGKLQIDQAGWSTNFLMIASWCILLPQKSFRRVLFTPISITVGLWVIYALVQFSIMHSPLLDTDIFVYYFGILNAFTFMFIIQKDVVEGHVHRIIKLLLWSYFIFSVLSFLFIGTSITNDNRTDIHYLNNPNDIAFAACICIFFSTIEYFSKKMNLAVLLTVSIIELSIIMGLGSRTAFLVVVLTAFMALSITLKHNKLKLPIIMICAIISLVLFINFQKFADSTMMGQRFSETSEQIEFQSGTLLDYVGDRGPFYYFGWFAFLDNPIFGIGLKNFAPYEIHDGLVCHSEYMVNLAETGIVGAILFWTYIVCLIVCLKRIKRHVVPFDYSFLVLAVIIPLFIALFFWIYDRSYIYALYGLIGGFYLRSSSPQRYLVIKQSNSLEIQ